MTLAELYQLLFRTGYPVTYSHFKEAQEPPYICYLEVGTENFFADGKVFRKVIDVDIELYTSKKDLRAEEAIETMLNDNGIPWEANEIYIDDEKVFKKTYEVRLI